MFHVLQGVRGPKDFDSKLLMPPHCMAQGGLEHSLSVSTLFKENFK